MKDNFTFAAIVGKIVQETECFFTEDIYEFLLFLDALLVKDTTKFVECVRSISAERRDVLCGILADIDGSRCDSRFCRAVCTSLYYGGN